MVRRPVERKRFDLTNTPREKPLLERELIVNDREKMILELLLMVRRIAHKLARTFHQEADDMFQVGCQRVIELVNRYSSGHTKEEEITFRSYAYTRIAGAMIDYLRMIDETPRSIRRIIEQVENATAQLWMKLGRKPTNTEIAEATEIALKRIETIAPYSLLSLNQPIGKMEGDDLLMGDELASEGPLQDELLATRRQVEIIVWAIQQLPPREAQLLKDYYLRERTMKDIARELGITESRISQLVTQAVNRLKRIVPVPDVVKRIELMHAAESPAPPVTPPQDEPQPGHLDPKRLQELLATVLPLFDQMMGIQRPRKKPRPS